MDRKRRYHTPWEPELAGATDRPEESRARMDVEMAMTFTLARALELRATTSHVIAHSRRVADLTRAIADLVDLQEAERDRLYLAAQLHEIGMVGVSSDLLTRRSALSLSEMEHVRSQARVSAEIVRVSHGQETARLIERQYEDYRYLRRTTLDSRELLLAGILRIADVYDAMSFPRPYQEPVPEERRRQILRVGSGTKFHPAAVFALLHLMDRSFAAGAQPS